MNNNRTPFFLSPTFHVVIMFVGVMFRLKHLLEDRSFWMDEAWVAVTIASRSLIEILGFVTIVPNASEPPLGFLLGSKLSMLALGNHELALRLFPFICSVLALWFFYRWIQPRFSPWVVTLAVILFSFSEHLIYFAAECKQYSSDVLAALLMYWCYEYCRREFNKSGFLILALGGAVMMWFSNAILFVLAGIGVVITFQCWFRGFRDHVLGLILVFTCWGWSFYWLYTGVLSRMMANTSLLSMWKKGLLTDPLLSKEGLMWVGDVWVNIFRHPGGGAFPYVLLVLFVIGIVRLFKIDWARCGVLFLPIVIVFIAALLGKYPFRSRLLLFITPALLLFICLGMEGLLKKFDRLKGVLFVILFVFVLCPPMYQGVYDLFHPHRPNDSRVAMQILKANVQEGDEIYFNNSGQYAFYYYQTALPGKVIWPHIRPIAAKAGGDILASRIGKFNDRLIDYDGEGAMFVKFTYKVFNEQGFFRMSYIQPDPLEIYGFKSNSLARFWEKSRTWIYFSHIKEDAEALILEKASKCGPMLQSYKGTDASVYLFDCR